MLKPNRWILVVIGVVLLVMTFTSPLSPYAARWLKQAWQIGHIFLFASWSLVFLPVLARRFSGLRVLLVLMLASLAGGLLIEFLQTFIDREFSLIDVVYDLIGSLLAFCALVFTGSISLSRAGRSLSYSTAAMLSLYAFIPLLSYSLDEIIMYRNFPVLADFDSALELSRWEGNIKKVSLLSPRGQQNALRISLNTNRYSGVALAHFPRDWRAYRQLQFDIFNPQRSPLKLTLRIHDDKHYAQGLGDYYDRFNRRFDIAPGWNTIAVALADIATAPRTRQMDMARIQGLGLFSVNLPADRIIYLDRLRLTP